MIRAMGLVKSSGNNQCRVRPVTTRFEPIYCGAAEEVIAGNGTLSFHLWFGKQVLVRKVI